MTVRRRDSDDQPKDRRPLRMWRYRYQLAPIYTAAALVVLVLLGHYTDRVMWTSITGGLIAAAALKAGWKLTTGERAVVGAAAFTAVGWYAWVVHRGLPPWDGYPKWGTALFLIPAALWWDHYRVRNQIAAQKKADAWGPWSRSVALAGTKLKHIAVSKWWWTGTISHVGYTFDQVKGAEELLEQHMGLNEDGVTIERTGKAGVCKITVVEKDPHAEAFLITDMPAPSRNPHDPIYIGPHVDGEFATVTLATPRGERHVLTGGSTDGGKTSFKNLLIHGSVEADDTVNVFADFKHGQAARPWAPAMGLVITEVEDFRDFLHDLMREAKWRGENVAGNSWVPQRDGAPRVRVWVDEFTEAAKDYRIVSLLESGMLRFRSLGIGWDLASQVTTNNGVGSTTIKGQCSIRACTRMEERSHAKHVLRDHALVDATRIPQDRPGSIYIEAEGARRGSLIRAAWMDRGYIEKYAKQQASRQPALSSLIGRSAFIGTATPTSSMKEPAVPKQSRFVDLEKAATVEAENLASLPVEPIADTFAAVGYGEEPSEPGDAAADTFILEFAARHAEDGFQISDVPAQEGLSRSTIGRAFGRLVRREKLRREGKGRATRYYPARELVSSVQ